RLKPIAADVGLTMPQLALAWCLRLSAVSSAIVGASSQKQLEENVGASGVSLSVGLREAIEEALRGEEE
ncbi:MAG: aldo/keto reductase, partial [Planctomycetota bacterium]